MNCLDNYIGLRGCGNSASPSNLYVNDLPAISLKQIVSLTNEEEATYLDMWNLIQKRAQNRFSLDLRESMTKHYKLNSLMQGINVGNILGSNYGNVFDSKQGFSIELIESATYQYVPSPLASIHIQELKYYQVPVAGNGLVEIEIIDISTLEVLWTYNGSAVDGWNTIPVNTTFHNNYSNNSWRLFVGYNTNNTTDYSSLSLPYNHTIPSCCDVRVRGAGINVGEQITFTNDTYGLSGIFSIVCNWDAIVCQNKTLFTRSYWYLLGIELLTEQLYSSKINQFTTIGLQKAKELREEYQVEYMKSLEQVAGGFKLNCDCCIECNEIVQVRESTNFY
jgi:hypothetical protein